MQDTTIAIRDRARRNAQPFSSPIVSLDPRHRTRVQKSPVQTVICEKPSTTPAESTDDSAQPHCPTVSGRSQKRELQQNRLNLNAESSLSVSHSF
jgi:hypothetical protein